MANRNWKIQNADLSILSSNLRGEIGEIITAWLLMRHFLATAQANRSDDLSEHQNNPELKISKLLSDKLSDEIVARLSELSENKIGQITFHFVAQKMGKFDSDVEKFTKFIIKNEFRKKRNYDISHKILDGNLEMREYIHIKYRLIIKAIAFAVRLMKKIDREIIGPASPFLWKSARKKRYNFLSPPRAGYMLLPYLNLEPNERIEILFQEHKEGKHDIALLSTKVDGRTVSIPASKRWGIIFINQHPIALERYPLIDLESISFGD